MVSGEGFSLPQFRGSRAERSHAELQRSAAIRGQSPREVGVGGEETHNLWRASSRGVRSERPAFLGSCADLLIPREAMSCLRRPGSRRHRCAREADHAASSASAGVLYPRAECKRWRL
jgi:hypothetical protein